MFFVVVFFDQRLFFYVLVFLTWRSAVFCLFFTWGSAGGRGRTSPPMLLLSSRQVRPSARQLVPSSPLCRGTRTLLAPSQELPGSAGDLFPCFSEPECQIWPGACMNLNQVLLSTFVSDITKSLHEVESIWRCWLPRRCEQEHQTLREAQTALLASPCKLLTSSSAHSHICHN